MWHDLIYKRKFRNFFSPSSGVQKSKPDVCRAMLPPKLWEDPSCLLLASSWLLVAQLLSHIWLLEALWTVAGQSSLFIEFSQQEYWSELPFPPPGIFPTQESNPHLLCLWHWQVVSLPLRSPGKPLIYIGIMYISLPMSHPHIPFWGWGTERKPWNQPSTLELYGFGLHGSSYMQIVFNLNIALQGLWLI